MQTCVVPCGKQQNTASTSEKLASAIAIRFGRFYRKKKISIKKSLSRTPLKNLKTRQRLWIHTYYLIHDKLAIEVIIYTRY